VVVLKTLPQPRALLIDRLEGSIEVSTDAVRALPAMARHPVAPLFDGVVAGPWGMMLTLAPQHLVPNVTPGAAPWRASTEIPEALPPLAERPPAQSSTGQLISFSTVDTLPHEPGLTFGLSVSQVPRILLAAPLLPVPGAAACVLGLVDWQGCPLAVIDLSRCLGGAASVVKPDSRLLIARASTTRACIGFPVRPDVKISGLPLARHVSPGHLRLSADLLRGAFALDHGILVIPDIDRLLAAHHHHMAKEAWSC
jgi:chemotaxis signal transduction protein